MTEKKMNFFYNSIIDLQGTIRAIDTKLGLLLIILVFPISNLSKIYQSIDLLSNNVNSTIGLLIFILIIIVFVFSWLLAFLAAFIALIAIDEPSKHINNDKKASGNFHLSGMFKLTYKDVFKNRKSIRSIRSLSGYFEDLSKIDELTELVFEQMKLSYIKDIKIKRQKWAYWLSLIWLISGFSIWLWKLILV